MVVNHRHSYFPIPSLDAAVRYELMSTRWKHVAHYSAAHGNNQSGFRLSQFSLNGIDWLRRLRRKDSVVISNTYSCRRVTRRAVDVKVQICTCTFMYFFFSPHKVCIDMHCVEAYLPKKKRSPVI